MHPMHLLFIESAPGIRQHHTALQRKQKFLSSRLQQHGLQEVQVVLQLPQGTGTALFLLNRIDEVRATGIFCSRDPMDDGGFEEKQKVLSQKRVDAVKQACRLDFLTGQGVPSATTC